MGRFPQLGGSHRVTGKGLEEALAGEWGSSPGQSKAASHWWLPGLKIQISSIECAAVIMEAWRIGLTYCVNEHFGLHVKSLLIASQRSEQTSGNHCPGSLSDLVLTTPGFGSLSDDCSRCSSVWMILNLVRCCMMEPMQTLIMIPEYTAFMRMFDATMFDRFCSASDKPKS